MNTTIQPAAPFALLAQGRNSHNGRIASLAHAIRQLVSILIPWLLPLLLVVGWQAASSLGWLSTRVLPAPIHVLTAGWDLAASGELWLHVGISTQRAFTGLAIGGGLGLLLGLLCASIRPLEQLLDSSIQMVRNIPALAMIPLVILWFGIEETAKLFLIAQAVFFPVYLNTFAGIRSVDGSLLEMGRAYGLSRGQQWWHIVLPAALPSILTGVRFALGLMWVILIVAETISAQSGIGYLTMNAREFLQTDVVLLGIVLYATLGKWADMAARRLEKRLLRWNPNYQ